APVLHAKALGNSNAKPQAAITWQQVSNLLFRSGKLKTCRHEKPRSRKRHGFGSLAAAGIGGKDGSRKASHIVFRMVEPRGRMCPTNRPPHHTGVAMSARRLEYLRGLLPLCLAAAWATHTVSVRDPPCKPEPAKEPIK